MKVLKVEINYVKENKMHKTHFDINQDALYKVPIHALEDSIVSI